MTTSNRVSEEKTSKSKKFAIEKRLVINQSAISKTIDSKSASKNNSVIVKNSSINHNTDNKNSNLTNLTHFTYANFKPGSSISNQSWSKQITQNPSIPSRNYDSKFKNTIEASKHFVTKLENKYLIENNNEMATSKPLITLNIQPNLQTQPTIKSRNLNILMNKTKATSKISQFHQFSTLSNIQSEKSKMTSKKSAEHLISTNQVQLNKIKSAGKIQTISMNGFKPNSYISSNKNQNKKTILTINQPVMSQNQSLKSKEYIQTEVKPVVVSNENKGSLGKLKMTKITSNIGNNNGTFTFKQVIKSEKKPLVPQNLFLQSALKKEKQK